LNEPEHAGRHHHDGAGEGESLPRASSRARSAASADATTATASSWPISTPMLIEISAAVSARAGRIHRAQRVGVAEAVDQTEGAGDERADVAAVADQQVVGADVDDAEPRSPARSAAPVG